MKEYKFKINGNEYNVLVGDVDENMAKVTVNGTKYKVDITSGGVRQSHTKTPRLVQARVDHTSGDQPVKIPVISSGEINSIKSPLPGVILDVKVKEGDQIKAGQSLMVLEAMKMENNIDSDRDGVVQSVKVRSGDSVMEGDVLVIIG